MKKAIFCILCTLSLAACADTYSLADQCAHEPGCVSTFQNGGTKIPQAVAIEANNAGAWEPAIPNKKPKNKK